MKKTLVGFLALFSLSVYAKDTFICSVNKLADTTNDFKVVVDKKVNVGQLSESKKFISFQITDLDKSGDDPMFKGQYGVAAWISDSDEAGPLNTIEYIGGTISKIQKVFQLQTGSAENHLNVFCEKK